MNKYLKTLAWISNTLLWIICLAPIKIKLPSPITREDLFYHALSYLLITIIFLTAYPSKRLVIGLGLVIQGILIEFIQPLTGRFLEVYDMIANSTGVLFAILLWLLFLNRLQLALFQKLNLSR